MNNNINNTEMKEWSEYLELKINFTIWFIHFYKRWSHIFSNTFPPKKPWNYTFPIALMQKIIYCTYTSICYPGKQLVLDKSSFKRFSIFNFVHWLAWTGLWGNLVTRNPWVNVLALADSFQHTIFKKISMQRKQTLI